tara:strand:+ start:2756 stop:3184 length:429 start_codon:yes stop_codon:yes gene_type:complete
VKCKICYAQLKKGSSSCTYCGTPISVEKHSREQEKTNREQEYDLDRLSPEFRQILESNSRKKDSEYVEENNLKVKESYEDLYFKKKPKRNWGVGQTVLEFFIYAIILGVVDGNLQQEDTVTAIYLIWSLIRAFNFFVLSKNK